MKSLTILLFLFSMLSGYKPLEAVEMYSLNAWEGKRPTDRVDGKDIFSAIAPFGDTSAEPILTPRDRATNISWGISQRVEIVNYVPFFGETHIMNGVIFSQCRSSSCSSSSPDGIWIVGTEGIRFHIYLAEKDPDGKGTRYCSYHIGRNGILTGFGYGTWRCIIPNTNVKTLPSGTPKEIARRIYAITYDIE